MSNTTIIGRVKEIDILTRIYQSEKSEFVALYGRRRVGKSFLIEEVFRNKICFSSVGLYFREDDKDITSYRQEQLQHFYDSLIEYGLTKDEPRPTC